MATKKRRAKRSCEYGDPGCPVHRGSGKCTKAARVTLRRIDMEDRSGTKMWRECASDALDSGVFA